MSDAPMRTQRTRRSRPAGFAAVPAEPDSDALPAPAAPDQQPEAVTPPADPPAGGSGRDPYAGAGTVQLNVRLLAPLRDRYAAQARELTDEGYKTSVTEILHALLDAGPTTAAETRDLLRAYRRRREP